MSRLDFKIFQIPNEKTKVRMRKMPARTDQKRFKIHKFIYFITFFRLLRFDRRRDCIQGNCS